MGLTLNPPQAANPGGFYEDMLFIRLNENILNAVKCNWRKPPTDGQLEALAETTDAVAKVRGIIEVREAEGAGSWGFKDHRAILLLPLYAPVLAERDCHFVVVHRNPLATACSFMRAWPDQFPRMAEALALAATYQWCIAAFLMTGEWKATHTSFERLFAAPQETAAALGEALGVRLAWEHLDPGLRHF